MSPAVTLDEYFDASTDLSWKVTALVDLPDGAPALERKMRVLDLVVGYALVYTGAASVAELRQLCRLFRKQERRMTEETLARQQKLMRAGMDPARAMQGSQQELAAVANRLLVNELVAFPRVEDAYRRCADPRTDPSKGYATRMLLDVRATAALFTEIALTPLGEAAHGHGPRTSVDLGSGSGILSLALAVAALRSGTGIAIQSHELVGHHVRLSAEVLGGLELPGDVRFDVHETDLTVAGAVGRVLDAVPAESPLLQWLSETFGYGTPTYELEAGSIRWKPRSTLGSRAAQSTLDPIQDILEQTCQHDPAFLDRVRSGAVWMFPNVTDDSFRPDEEASTIRLTRLGGDHVPLHRVGEHFGEFEDLGMHDRWEDPEIVRRAASRAAPRGGGKRRPRKRKR